jgi:hypothetical protein
MIPFINGEFIADRPAAQRVFSRGLIWVERGVLLGAAGATFATRLHLNLLTAILA